MPSAPPQDIQCGSLTAQSLQLNWRSPPSSKAHGLIQGYKVLYEPADEWFGKFEIWYMHTSDSSGKIFHLLLLIKLLK